MTLDPLEVIAVGFGIVSVYLSVRENIWSWPTALVTVSLSFLVYRREHLYANMGLQVFFAAISIYGWYHWLFGGEGRTALKVSKTPRAFWIPLALVGGIGTVGLGTILRRTTDAAIPFLDSALTVSSILAQWMMSRKYVENWMVWVGLNVTYIGMFLLRGPGLFALLYAVYLFLAVWGYFSWRRSWLQQHRTLGIPAESPLGGAA